MDADIPLKIAFTIADATDMAMAGGETTRITYIIEIPSDKIPKSLARFLKCRAEWFDTVNSGNAKHAHFTYQSMSISTVED